MNINKNIFKCRSIIIYICSIVYLFIGIVVIIIVIIIIIIRHSIGGIVYIHIYIIIIIAGT